MRQTRRFVLASLGGLAGLPLLAPAGFGSDTSVNATTVRLRALLADTQRARTFGRGYRAQVPAEVQPAVLTGLLCSSLGLDGAAIAALDHDALLATLDARVRQEFSRGDTVQVSGWILARSEGRLCALCE
jgi:hypothetical protein